jgi:hypothetical protein
MVISIMNVNIAFTILSEEVIELIEEAEKPEVFQDECNNDNVTLAST